MRREGGKEGRRKGGKEGRREGGKEGRREGGKEGRREGKMRNEERIGGREGVGMMFSYLRVCTHLCTCAHEYSVVQYTMPR